MTSGPRAIEPEGLETKQAAAFVGLNPKALKRQPIPRARIGHRTLIWRVEDLRLWLKGRAA